MRTSFWRAELACQLLGQTQSHVRGFAIHHDGRGALCDKEAGGCPGPTQRVRSARGTSIGEHDDEAAPRPVARFLAHHHVAGGQ